MVIEGATVEGQTAHLQAGLCRWCSPVFANIRHNKKMNRFTVRGKAKVNTQWHLFCLVHNIEKMATAKRQKG